MNNTNVNKNKQKWHSNTRVLEEVHMVRRVILEEVHMVRRGHTGRGTHGKEGHTGRGTHGKEGSYWKKYTW